MTTEHRHPRCITPPGEASTDAAVIADLRRELAARDERIAALEGELARAAGSRS